VLLDSVAVAGFLHREDAFHAAADERIRAAAGKDRLVASVVTYAELLRGAEVGHHDVETVRGFFAELIDDLLPVDRPVAERAAALRGRTRRLQMADALILATAEQHAADLVIGADAHWIDIPGYGCQVELLRSA
jgi:predicted nucleic acid-binding protein